MSVLLELNRGRDEQTQDKEAGRAQSVKVYSMYYEIKVGNALLWQGQCNYTLLLNA